MPANDSELNSLVDFFGKSLKIDKSDDAKLIIEELQKCREMTSLRLAGNTFGVEASKTIGSELEYHKKLSKCYFSDMFTGRMVDEIAPALTYLSSGMITAGAKLTELDLSDNAFGPRGVVGVTDLLSSPACYTLKVLKMNNQGLGHQGCRYLAEALSKGITESGGKGLKLSYFSAGRNRLENVGAILLADVFSKMASLEELHLYQNGIGIHGIDGIRSLAGAISRNTKMRVLNLSDNSLTAEGGIEIAKALPSLVHLEDLILDDCLIRSRGCRALAAALSHAETVPMLRSLSLYGNEISRGAGVNLVLALSEKSHISRMNLNANDFGPTGIDMILNTLGSVDMLHILEVPVAEEGELDSSITPYSDVQHQAFCEDQGSDCEDDEEYEESEDDYQEDGEADANVFDFYNESDEYASSYSLPGNESRSGNSSFDTVKEHPTYPVLDNPNDESSKNDDRNNMKKTSPFCFRSCLNDLQSEAIPPSGGLFSGIDITDASACRSKLWSNSTNLSSNFGPLFTPPRLGTLIPQSTVNQPANTQKLLIPNNTAAPCQFSPLFSPPRLGPITSQPLVCQPSNTQKSLPSNSFAASSHFESSFAPLRLGTINSHTLISPPPDSLESRISRDNVDQTFKENEILDLLKKCALFPNDDFSEKKLCEKLSALKEWNIPESRLNDLFTSPELAVRFAFRLTRQVSPNDASKDLAVRTLLSAFTVPASFPGNELISQAGRAVNHILVHLGAVKPDRDDDVERRIAEISSNHVRTDFDLLNTLLIRHGDRLPDSARQSLALLLNQYKTVNPAPSTVADLLDGVLDVLENKLGALSVS